VQSKIEKEEKIRDAIYQTNDEETSDFIQLASENCFGWENSCVLTRLLIEFPLVSAILFDISRVF
jgi:hypothetical protein